MNKQDFIDKVKDGAIECMKLYNILASVTIAQAIVESGWGESQLTKIANNLFGIKRWGYADFISMNTTEYVNGVPIKVQANFRRYNSWKDSIIDHGKFLIENKRYENILGGKDSNGVADLLQKDGYATDPNYASKLKSIISDNNLENFDVISNTSVTKLQHNLNKIFKLKLAEDGILGPLTHGAMDNGAKVFGVNGIDDLIVATNDVLKFPLDSLKAPHYEYATRYIQYRCGRALDKRGVFWYGTMSCVQNWQSPRGLKSDGIVGPLTWAALMK